MFILVLFISYLTKNVLFCEFESETFLIHCLVVFQIVRTCDDFRKDFLHFLLDLLSFCILTLVYFPSHRFVTMSFDGDN